MNRLLSVLGALILVLMCAPRAWAANISVTINQPAAGAIVLDSLSVTATATSLYQLKSVHADVETAGVDLAAGGGTWSGTLSLSSLARGTKTLTVTATDIMNQTATAQVSFAKDAPPSIVILDPVDGTVGRPQLHIAGTCVDDDPAGCAKFQAFVGSTLVASGTSSVDVTVSLDSYIAEDTATTISFQATDSVGQFTYRNITAVLDTDPRLVAIESFPGIVMDFDDTRALYCTPNCINGVYLYDRMTKQSTLLNPPPFRGETEAWLSSTGVVIQQNGGGGGEVYDYRAGQFKDLGATNSNLNVGGASAVWFDNAKNVVLGDLTTDTTKVIGANINMNGAGILAMGPTGDVAYVSTVGSSDQVFRYHNGATTQISQGDADGYVIFLALDEVNVGYIKSTNRSAGLPGISLWTMLFGPSGLTQLAPPADGQDVGILQLTAGYVLFPRVAGGVAQVILRDPLGQETQLSIFGTSSAPISVSPMGVAIWSNGKTYYRSSTSNPQPEAVGGGIVWRSAGWMAVRGNTIFCFNDGSGSDSPCTGGGASTGAGGAAASTGNGSTASTGGTSASGGGANAGTGGSASSSTSSSSSVSSSAVGVGGSTSSANGGGGTSSSSASSTSGTSVGTGTGGSGGVGGGTGSSVNSTVGSSSTAAAGGIVAGSGGMPPSGSSSDSGGGCTISGDTRRASGFAGYLLAGLTLSLMHRRRRASGRHHGSHAAA